MATPVAPAPQAVADDTRPREVEVDIPHLTLADGRTLGFSTTRSPFSRVDIWETTEVIHPWLRVDETQAKVPLPVIPSQREAFTAIQLEDGRLALIGGNTPSDIVAVERQCTDCPEQYIPFGAATASTTTDVFDFESGTWSKGPTARHPGTTALRLRDGSLLKAGIDDIASSAKTYGVHVETADSAFTRWEKSGEAQLDAWLSDVRILESREGAVILLSRGSSLRGFHWTPKGKLEPWLEVESWIEMEQLDEGHLQLTLYSGDANHPKKQIVELP